MKLLLYGTSQFLFLSQFPKQDSRVTTQHFHDISYYKKSRDDLGYAGGSVWVLCNTMPFYETLSICLFGYPRGFCKLSPLDTEGLGHSCRHSCPLLSSLETLRSTTMDICFHYGSVTQIRWINPVVGMDEAYLDFKGVILQSSLSILF